MRPVPSHPSESRDTDFQPSGVLLPWEPPMEWLDEAGGGDAGGAVDQFRISWASGATAVLPGPDTDALSLH